MKIRNTKQGYGWLAIGLHWLLAIAIIGTFALGLYMTDLGYYDPLRKLLPDIHRSIGVIIGALFIIRIIWKWWNVSPDHGDHKQWEIKLAKIVHGLLYLLVFTIVITGYLISTADGRAVSVFEIFEIPAIVTSVENMEDLAGDVHYWLAVIMMLLVMLHAAGALKHHFIDKDNTLKKMLGSYPKPQNTSEGENH